MDQIIVILIVLILCLIIGIIIGKKTMLSTLTTSIKSIIDAKSTVNNKQDAESIYNNIRFSYKVLHLVNELKKEADNNKNGIKETIEYLNNFENMNKINTSSDIPNNNYESIKSQYDALVIERDQINKKKLSLNNNLTTCKQNLEWYKNELSKRKNEVDLYKFKLNENKKEVEQYKSKLSDNNKEFGISNYEKYKHDKEQESSNTKMNDYKRIDNTKESISLQDDDKPETYRKKTFFKNKNEFNKIKSIKTIYFSMPESNGSFKISNGELSNDGKKYFKIEYKESSGQGEILFLSSDRDQRAINRLESYLKPVCEIENILNSRVATKIELIQSGKVSLINDNWVINQNNKIKIKLY